MEKPTVMNCNIAACVKATKGLAAVAIKNGTLTVAACGGIAAAVA